MKHPLLRFWLRIAVAGSGLVLGCGQVPSSGTSGSLTPPSAWAPDANSQTAPPSPPARRPEVRVLEVVPERAPTAPTDAATVSVSAYRVPSPARCDETRCDATTSYGHAPDYRWLTGELRYAQVRQAWCLRYAGEEDQDRYGGSVTLVTSGMTTGLRPGQAVRVEGELIDPESRDPSPAYRVRGLTPLPKR
jgi:hypothetical protein